MRTSLIATPCQAVYVCSDPVIREEGGTISQLLGSGGGPLGKLADDGLFQCPRGLEDAFSLGTSRFPSGLLCARRAGSCLLRCPFPQLSALLSRPPCARCAGADLPRSSSLRLPSARDPPPHSVDRRACSPAGACPSSGSPRRTPLFLPPRSARLHNRQIAWTLSRLLTA